MPLIASIYTTLYKMYVRIYQVCPLMREELLCGYALAYWNDQENHTN